MRTPILLTLFFVILSVTAQASDTGKQPDRYVCVGDKSVGLNYKEHLKTWDYAHFRSETKYIVSASPNTDFAFTITQTGKNVLFGRCKDGFNEYGLMFVMLSLVNSGSTGITEDLSIPS